MASPLETSTRTTSPAVTFSPSSGSVKSVGMMNVSPLPQLACGSPCRADSGGTASRRSAGGRILAARRVGLLGVDVEILDSPRDDLRVDLAVLRQLGQRGQRHEASVDL